MCTLVPEISMLCTKMFHEILGSREALLADQALLRQQFLDIPIEQDLCNRSTLGCLHSQTVGIKLGVGKHGTVLQGFVVISKVLL